MKKKIPGQIMVLAFAGGLFALGLLLAYGKIDVPTAKKVAAWTGLVILVAGSIYLLYDKNALRDASLQENKPYSFSRVQLWWWTLIIVGSLFGIYASTGTYWQLNPTCLVLLGISSITTISGRMVDTRDHADPEITRSQDLHPSQGLLNDILSDNHGLSMHRFQSLVFNIAYGLAFVVEVFSNPLKGSFPVYDASVLAMLGVSSAAFLAMKMSENKTVAPEKPADTLQAAPVVIAPTVENDQLVDAEALNVNPADN
jgi:hypothetical protein